MTKKEFAIKQNEMFESYNRFIKIKNTKLPSENGIYHRYKNPVLTTEHIPLHWRYDFTYEDNPFLLERLGVNAVFNSGAIKLNGKYYLVPRIEGHDRKSFFAVAESPNGIDNFKFMDYPIILPPTNDPDVNVYDIR